MKIFKLSYKQVRKNSEEIYKAFGFKHLSYATHFYLHHIMQSYQGTTTLFLPLGEAVVLFSQLCGSLSSDSDEIKGDFYVGDGSEQVFLRIEVPRDWHEQGVIETEITRYEALVHGDQITVAAYDRLGHWIDGDMDSIQPLYKLLPCFLVLLARDCRMNSDFFQMLLDFAENPAADVFVNLHEDFYQAHKNEEFEISYASLAGFDSSELVAYGESMRTISTNKSAMQNGNVREISIPTFEEDDFLPEYRAMIPCMGKEFVLPQEVRGLCPAIMNGDIFTALFHGPAGTGKTSSCKLLCQEIRLPILATINCTENLDEFILGKYIPMDGKIIFQESMVTRAIRDGGAVVFEEINFAKPQYLAFLNSLLDDNGFVRLDDNTVVRRHQNFRFFATMNMGYYGTKELNQALYNRFQAVVELSELQDDAIIRMLTVRVPSCKKKVDKMLTVYHKLKKKIEAEELELVISPRNLENWARLAKYEGYLKAAEKTIIPIAKCDRTMEKVIRGILVLYKWD